MIAEFVDTPVGRVKFVPLNHNEPGWRTLNIETGKQIKEDLIKLLPEWGIVAFETGKLGGKGYGYQFHDTYGPECGNKFVVQTKLGENEILTSLGIVKKIPKGCIPNGWRQL